ncbi:MAG: hypothetical protein IPQ07_33465 [Myxococcales bacterium]|nr:hypothetical protein [Myxococcales bacterium]
MKVRFAESARASIRYRHTWWRANRDKAPRLFIEELRDVVSKLRRDTDVARQHYSGQGEAAVWRLLMPKTRHHAYYTRDERGTSRTSCSWTARSAR